MTESMAIHIRAVEVAEGHLGDPLVAAWREAHPDATAELLLDTGGAWTLPDGVSLDMVRDAIDGILDCEAAAALDRAEESQQ